MNIFSYIKTKINILEVVGEYTNLKRAGNYWKGHCPLHSEKTASFTVSPGREIFYCFGCHIGGDIITFISKVEGCTPIEAVNHLSEKYQIHIPEKLKSEIIHSSEAKNRYFDLCEMVAQWCHGNLLKSPHVIRYLHQRGFNKTSIDNFQIGYFPGGLRSIKALTNYVGKKSMLQDDLIEAKIVAEGKKVLYSPFEDRIMFPIKDQVGRFCGFGGRIFKENDQRAKYYNSHENDYFNKGSLLFGFDVAKNSIKKSERIFLVEGYTDCIAMSQHGFENTVATLGTACSIEHLKTLSRYVQEIYVMYDGDNAGKKAIMRLTDLCWQVNLELKIITLQADQDPASFLQNKGDLHKKIEEAKDIFVCFIESVGQEFESKSLGQKLAMARKIIATITNLQDPIKVELLIQRASKTLGISIESIKHEFVSSNSKTSKKPLLNKPRRIPAPQQTPNIDLRLEKKIFFGIINNVKLLNKDNENFLIEYFPSPLKEILEKLKEAKAKQPLINFMTFFDTLNDNERQYLSKIVLECDGEIEEKTFEQLLLKFQKKNWKYIVQKIKTKLAYAKDRKNENEVSQILNNFLELKKNLLSFGESKPRGFIDEDNR